MSLALLEVANGQLGHFMTPEPTRKQEDRSARSRLPLSRSLSGTCQSVAPCSAVNQLSSLTPRFFTPLTLDSGRQVGAEEAAVCGFVRQSANRPQTEVDRPRGEMSRLQMHPVANDHRLI